MKNDFPSSEVSEYNEAECDWLNLNPIYCNNQSSGVTGDNNIESDVHGIFEDTRIDETENIESDDVVVSESSGVTVDDDIDNHVNDSDVFMKKSSGVTGDNTFESNVCDDGVIVSWSTERESPVVT